MKARTMKFAKWMFILVVATLVLSSGYQAYSSANDRQAYPPPGQMIDVGGHHLHVDCQGEGDPTVVLEAGMSGWSTDWVLVQPEVAKTTRVCAYDRAGYGWSETGPRPRDSEQVATELHALLSEAGVTGDLILVGHSLGGLYTQYYARRYPEQVAGIVLVDAVHPEQSLRMREDVRDKYEGDLKTLTVMSSLLAPTGLLRLSGQSVTVIADKLPGNYAAMARSVGFQSKAYQALAGEMASFQRSQSQVRDAGLLPPIQVVTISSSLVQDFPPGFSAGVKRAWDELQADQGRMATLPPVIAADSGHFVHIDEPEVVIETVVDMVALTRGK